MTHPISSLTPLLHIVHPLLFLAGSTVLAAFLLWILFYGRGWNSHGLPYPPGPRPLPLVGNLFQVNTAEPWLTYTAWKKKYGELELLTVKV